MRRQKGVDKETAKGLLFVFIFTLSIVPFALSSMDESIQEEEKKAQKKNQLLVLPIIYYTPETKIAGGVGGLYYLRTLEDELKGRPSTIFVDLIYTQKKQSIFEITPDVYLKKGKFHLVGYAGLKDYTENFYGIGSGTTDNMEEDYSYRSFKLKCSLRDRIGSSFYAGLQYDFEHSKITEIEPGGMLDTGYILGSEGGTISGLGILLIQDNRDSTFFPTKGTLLQLQASLFFRAIGSDYNFQKYNLDYRQYVTVFSKHVLAFQENVSITSGHVPFQWLPFLGGPWIMRGYIQGRFRDKKAIFFQMEYRMPLFWRLSAAGFVGYGDVADKLKSFELNNFKITGGLGIRYQINRMSGTNVRLDFGFAEGNFSVYAMINEAF
jgi:outer membrane protein assembly factor BamA